MAFVKQVESVQQLHTAFFFRMSISDGLFFLANNKQEIREPLDLLLVCP